MAKYKWSDNYTPDAPPNKRRKLTEPSRKHNDGEWDKWKSRIEDLYKQHTLMEARDKLEEEGFIVSQRQLRIRLQAWEGNSKYTKLNNSQWEYIEYQVKKRLVDCPEKKTAVRFKGALVPVPKKNILRNMRQRLKGRVTSDGISICGSISSRGISIYTSNTHGIDLQIFKQREPAQAEAIPTRLTSLKRWSSLRGPSSGGDAYECMLWHCVHEMSMKNPRDQFAVEISECLYGGHCFNLKCRDCPQYRYKHKKPWSLAICLVDRPLIIWLLRKFQKTHLNDEQHRAMVDSRYNEEARRKELMPIGIKGFSTYIKGTKLLVNDDVTFNYGELDDINDEKYLCECMSLRNSTHFHWPKVAEIDEEIGSLMRPAKITVPEGERNTGLGSDNGEEDQGERDDADNIMSEEEHASNDFLESWLQNSKKHDADNIPLEGEHAFNDLLDSRLRNEETEITDKIQREKEHAFNTFLNFWLQNNEKDDADDLPLEEEHAFNDFLDSWLQNDDNVHIPAQELETFNFEFLNWEPGDHVPSSSPEVSEYQEERDLHEVVTEILEDSKYKMPNQNDEGAWHRVDNYKTVWDELDLAQADDLALELINSWESNITKFPMDDL